jgi:hypothetical protein
MRNKRVGVSTENEEVKIRKRKKLYGGAFTRKIEFKCAEGKLRSQELNVVGVSIEDFAGLSEEKLLMCSSSGGDFINVTVVRDDAAPPGCFIPTNYVKNRLELKAGDRVYMCVYAGNVLKKFVLQRLEKIQSNDFMISKADYDELIGAPRVKDCAFFEIYNTLTKDSVVVKRKHILKDDTLKKGQIRLNRKQRICLGLELPMQLTPRQWEMLLEKSDGKNDVAGTVKAVYGDDLVLNESASYEAKRAALEQIEKHCRGGLKIIPVFESAGSSTRRGFFRTLSDFYVGKSVIFLACRRPYDNDEGLNVVRLSKSNMKLLGVEEMDNVILRYKRKKVKCRVLEMDDVQSFFKTNKPFPPEFSIGVPAHIRTKLGIGDLNSSVKVERDTAFIFKKSLNEQIVPVLLTLFSAGALFDKSALLSVGLSAAAIPIVLYINLSSKRNMRSK